MMLAHKQSQISSFIVKGLRDTTLLFHCLVKPESKKVKKTRKVQGTLNEDEL